MWMNPSEGRDLICRSEKDRVEMIHFGGKKFGGKKLRSEWGGKVEGFPK
jgi:hypothetical protein